MLGASKPISFVYGWITISLKSSGKDVQPDSKEGFSNLLRLQFQER